MALEFPQNPTNGQIYSDFYWDDTAQIWRRLVDAKTLGNLEDVNISSVAAGNSIVYNDVSEQWENQTLSYTYDINDLTSLDSDDIITAPNYDIDVIDSTSPGTFNLDFSSGEGLVNMSINETTTFTGSNYKAGSIKTVRIVNQNVSDITLNFPAGWTFVGLTPTEITGSKTAILTMTSFTNAESGCVAAYIEEL